MRVVTNLHLKSTRGYEQNEVCLHNKEKVTEHVTTIHLLLVTYSDLKIHKSLLDFRRSLVMKHQVDYLANF